jgi:hypothetical protein
MIKFGNMVAVKRQQRTAAKKVFAMELKKQFGNMNEIKLC